MAFSQDAELGLTDLEMANGYEYDDDYDADRAFDMEYEVRDGIGQLNYAFTIFKGLPVFFFFF